MTTCCHGPCRLDMWRRVEEYDAICWRRTWALEPGCVVVLLKTIGGADGTFPDVVEETTCSPWGSLEATSAPCIFSRGLEFVYARFCYYWGEVAPLDRLKSAADGSEIGLQIMPFGRRGPARRLHAGCLLREGLGAVVHGILAAARASPKAPQTQMPACVCVCVCASVAVATSLHSVCACACVCMPCHCTALFELFSLTTRCWLILVERLVPGDGHRLLGVWRLSALLCFVVCVCLRAFGFHPWQWSRGSPGSGVCAPVFCGARWGLPFRTGSMQLTLVA